MKPREATLKPKHIQIWVHDHKMCVQYNVMDEKTGFKLTDVFVNFEPSEQLLSLLESEVDTAINQYKLL